MAGTDLATRTQETVALIDHPQFLEQVEALLPENVPLRRFVMTAKTAIRTNPDLVDADQNSLFGAIIRCAQDGLFPDGHEAALVPYKGKVNYLPMVHGVIRAARDYGWLMVAQAVYEKDVFEWRGNNEKPLHRHPKPGEPRGNLVAAYAYASQRGEVLAEVLYAPDIEKRKKKAQTQIVWNEWPEAMWAKSAAHALFRKLPRSERDRVERFTDIDDPADAEAALYGPDGSSFAAHEISAAPSDTAGSPSSPEALRAPAEETQQAAASSSSLGEAAAPGTADDDPEPQPAWVAAGNTVVESGNWAGKTIADVATVEAGVEWIGWALARPAKFDAGFHEALAAYVEGALPELWAAHTERSAA